MATERNKLTSQEVLGYLDKLVKREFDSNLRILNFEEYLSFVAEHPARQLRGSAKYTADMMDHFGTAEHKSHEFEPAVKRFNLFDLPVEDISSKVVGQEQVQNHLSGALRTFCRLGQNNKLILLHGPNGSAKTSLIHAIMGGMEKYSREPDGAIYAFNWMFPVERYTKGSIGITNTHKNTNIGSYAKLPDEEVLARIPCDMCDHPLLVIPLEQRKLFLEKLLSPAKADELWHQMPSYLTKGDLCHRCKQIFEALLGANAGDLQKVLMHIQVERFYFSRRYRKGLVTIEPQMHVDAQYNQLTYNKSLGNLPPSLQSLNLFSLSGDLVDGNRGIIEYSDLLKRPVDAFKYLLVACETGAVNVGASIAYIDAVMLGSANEVQLDAFKEFPDFTSFKARIDLAKVPYLLRASQEREIYQNDLKHISADRHVAPHTEWALALWAVLTRLRKPNSINYPPNVSTIVSALTPLDKAKLYDTGEMPVSLTPEERKTLRSAFQQIRDEFTQTPGYEGRLGASAREMKSVLYGAAQNPEFPCLSPLAVLREMEELTKRTSEYEFLRQDKQEGYCDAAELIGVVRREYLDFIDREVRDSIGLYDSQQWEDFLKKYVQHVSLMLKGEKIKNRITGKLEDPDLSLVEELEKIIEAPGGDSDKAQFRSNVIARVGAWSIDHPKETVTYARVFPEFWRKLEKHYYESQKAVLTKMHNALLLYGNSKPDIGEEGSRLAYQTVENMKLKLGYCENCAKEVITFLMKQRY